MTALLLFKASLLLSVTLLAVFLLRRRSAASRHRLWTLAFVALLALPLLPLALPAIDVPLPGGAIAPPRPRVAADPPPAAATPPPSPLSAQAERASAGVALRREPTGDTVTASAARPLSPPRVYALLFAVWLVGAVIALGALALSLLRVWRLSRAARELSDGAWRHAADALGVRLGLSRPVRLLVSADVSTPMAAGLLRPTIFLPVSASDWDAERRDIVLAHEIAHLAVRDPLRHVTARLAMSGYWFHPLAWIAARQGMLAREQACDEAVLALGARPSTYARVLLDLAGSLSEPLPAHAALPMVQRSMLETRLMAILNDSRPAMARRAALPVVAMALLTAALAAARPASPTLNNVGADPAETSSIDVSASATPAPTVASPGPDAAAARVETTTQVGSRADLACGSDQWGSHGSDRIIQQSFGDLRVCMVAEGLRDQSWEAPPSTWPASARRVRLESRRGNAVQRLEMVRREGESQSTWQVQGVTRPFDAAAQQWRDRTLAALDTSWEISSLRGEVSSLRGDISSVRGEESSLRGEISSLQGDVSSMRGNASSVRGDESSLRGEISSIHGHVSSLRGQISSERGEISSLQSAMSIDDPVIRERVGARVAKHNQEIARIEREIRDYGEEARVAAVEKQIAALDANGKVAAIEAQIRAFDLQSKIAAVERRITELDVAGKVAAIQRRIEALDADRKVRQLEERRDGEVKQLERAIAGLR
jgi:beta-lactamase regulating signal transducer with metallopeptidase domain